jgi:predicted pyridoxine 5'-phosphate oxidase superfamily flavin-nucleotide-binding protein
MKKFVPSQTTTPQVASTLADDSPFHSGEQAIQSRVGSRDRVEESGRRLIRHYMPDQHRQFFAQLPLFFVATVDAQGRPWASPLVGAPGFLHSPEPHLLHVAARPLYGDPLNETLCDGAMIGGLGIEFHTRRRNRVNGTVILDPDGAGFTLRVKQSFGNCPQYINARQWNLDPLAHRYSQPRSVRRGDRLDDATRALISRADTFFIASCYTSSEDQRHGADVSHRGGRPGFVQIKNDSALLFPDYRGNFLFNTLGNLLVNPRCGLLFLDFDSGDTLQLIGKGEIVWEWPRDDPAFRGAQRLVRFHIDGTVHIEGAVPFVWDFLSQAPQFSESGAA